MFVLTMYSEYSIEHKIHIVNANNGNNARIFYLI